MRPHPRVARALVILAVLPAAHLAGCTVMPPRPAAPSARDLGVRPELRVTDASHRRAAFHAAPGPRAIAN